MIRILQELDFEKIGFRIKNVRIEAGLSQAELGSLVGCSNNHISHIEVGQTKVSLSLLMKISYFLNKDISYFLLDSPFSYKENIINKEIADKLKRCNSSTLISISKIIDVLLEQQNNNNF